MECGKPGGKPDAAELPPFEPMTVGEAFLSSSEDCQRAANGVFGGNPGKWPYSLIGGGNTDDGGSDGQRIRSSFAERGDQGFPEGGGDE